MLGLSVSRQCYSNAKVYANLTRLLVDFHKQARYVLCGQLMRWIEDGYRNSPMSLS